MKKSLIIIFFIAIILCIATTCVLAESGPISLEGETSVAPGSTGTVNVKISSSDTIGVVSGIIGYDSNITNVEVSGKNNWSLTYNSETGKFNIYNPEGAETEEIIQIKYTVSNTEGTGTITLSNLQVTNMKYETENVSDVTKTITIENSTISDPTDDPADDPTDDPTNDPSDDNNQNNTNDGKNTNIGTSNGTNANGTNTSKTTTTAPGKTLPYAGIMTKVVLPIGIVLVGVVSVGTYIGYKKYKGIK